jgi:hypothetical protein
MKKIMSLASVVLMAACSTTPVPVAMKFPDVPKELLISCEDLQMLQEDQLQMSELLRVVVANYGRYHECRLKMDNWIVWYNSQKEIFNTVIK